MTNVCTQAGLNRSENRLWIPANAPDMPEPLCGDGERDSGDEGGETGGAGSLEFDRDFLDPIRPDSSMYGVIEDRRRPNFRASSSFSSSSSSTSFISSLTPASGLMVYPSLSILAPNIRNSPAARKLVRRLGMRAGTAWPKMADRTVMGARAENAAENTKRRSYFMAMRAAIRKVLSPISENRIIVKERIYE